MKAYVARDKTGELYMYSSKPMLVGPDSSNQMAWDNGESCWLLKDDDFPNVTFENSPKCVTIKLFKP
jgi:hypothetical protein